MLCRGLAKISDLLGRMEREKEREREREWRLSVLLARFDDDDDDDDDDACRGVIFDNQWIVKCELDDFILSNNIVILALQYFIWALLSTIRFYTNIYKCIQWNGI